MLVPVIAFSQSRKRKAKAGYTEQDYEITCAGVGVKGTKALWVASYGPTVNKASQNAKRNAVHGVIFKGARQEGADCPGGILPLSKSVIDETKYEEFYKVFFKEGGDYLKFVSFVSEGGNNQDIVKVDKRTYKVTVLVSINYDKLRQELEAAGVIKKLNAGF